MNWIRATDKAIRLGWLYCRGRINSSVTQTTCATLGSLCFALLRSQSLGPRSLAVADTLRSTELTSSHTAPWRCLLGRACALPLLAFPLAYSSRASISSAVRSSPTGRLSMSSCVGHRTASLATVSHTMLIDASSLNRITCAICLTLCVLISTCERRLSCW